ncbi:PadR family transcriptional regulator [Paenalkalicoccus suaedae]|uniref:PadR family transcriptional regulator n=1 Tax=Paenalkalicoccus suaedae TaxID=2592382 RepID=A0A859F9S1_9BACI|nr:PadR family transcriptional regulator [Paenalkalicoccus suaedae]QKS69933.1 PadR family transcriptional regulator [Paenalkalicoccus suaedae]
MTNEKVVKKYVPASETAYYIMLVLYESPRHGYGISKRVEVLTDGRIQLGSGTIYGTITKMLKDGLIVMYANEERKKVYELTEIGEAILRMEIDRIAELHRHASEIGGEAACKKTAEQ